jgi:hypothetical protein
VSQLNQVPGKETREVLDGSISLGQGPVRLWTSHGAGEVPYFISTNGGTPQLDSVRRCRMENNLGCYICRHFVQSRRQEQKEVVIGAVVGRQVDITYAISHG